MIVILESTPINIPNPKKCRVNHGLSAEIPYEEGVKPKGKITPEQQKQ